MRPLRYMNKIAQSDAPKRERFRADDCNPNSLPAFTSQVGLFGLKGPFIDPRLGPDMEV